MPNEDREMTICHVLNARKKNRGHVGFLKTLN